MVFGDPIPQNPNLALPNEAQRAIGNVDNERLRTNKLPSETLLDFKTGYHTSLFRELLTSLEPKSQSTRRDMEDAVGSVEYLFALGLDPKDRLIGSLNKGNTHETLITPTVKFVRGYLDKNKDKPTVIHYHGQGYLTGKVVPFFSPEDLAFALDGSYLPPFNFALHMQQSPTVWVLAPFDHLKPYDKSRNVRVSSVPVVTNPENPQQISEVSRFLNQHGHGLYKTNIKVFDSKLRRG